MIPGTSYILEALQRADTALADYGTRLLVESGIDLPVIRLDGAKGLRRLAHLLFDHAAHDWHTNGRATIGTVKACQAWRTWRDMISLSADIHRAALQPREPLTQVIQSVASTFNAPWKDRTFGDFDLDRAFRSLADCAKLASIMRRERHNSRVWGEWPVEACE